MKTSSCLSSGRGASVHLGRSLASFNVTVVQTQRNQLLEAGIDLFVHSWVLRGDAAELLKQAGTAIVVVPLCIL